MLTSLSSILFFRHIKAHEAECKYGPYVCPLRDSLDCSWKGKISEVLNHTASSHPDNILDFDTITTPYFEDNNEEEDCFVFEKHDETFRVIFRRDEHNCYWSVQLIGPKEDSERFMYVLDVLDTNGDSKQRLFVKKPCSRYVKDEEAFADWGMHVRMPLEMIRGMIGSEFSYRLQIVKK